MIGVVMIMIRLGFRAQLWHLGEEVMKYERIAWVMGQRIRFWVVEGVIGKD